MMEFSCFSNSPNGPTTHTHTHMQCKDSNSNCLLLSLDPSSCKCTSFCVVQSIFFLFCMNFLLWFLHTAHRVKERESERKRGREAVKLVTFLIYQQYANDAQFKAHNWVWCLPPLFQYLQSLQFHLRFYMLFIGGTAWTYLKIERKKSEKQLLVWTECFTVFLNGF